MVFRPRPTDDGTDLPIPNGARNRGGSIIVWSGHPGKQPVHPWHNAQANHQKGSVVLGNGLNELEASPSGSPLSPSASSLQNRRIFNLRPSTLILSCILFLVTSALIVVGTLLGSKIAKLENTIPGLALHSSPDSANQTSPGHNQNSPSSSSTSSSPSATTTYAASPSDLPPPLPPTISVSGWTYLGCYYDSEVRILPDAFLSAVNMTNQVCSEYCTNSYTNKNNNNSNNQRRRTAPRHFGTQVALQCYCGTADNAVLATRRAPDWQCMHQCAGRMSAAERCGGDWALTLWERDG
ncbi:uncharacterized protein C8A04DRAFT_27872 [Dichotomopilus funicola]|uniref:WSC domain-containing protein n=1 Tax=Dichotomopilus funicola TaxID=1934379 RepID=A0AAN6V452_9PEZI|nr:hypothetical protein C8A04DRAFT_27872 [Dichotomopilus funicola]